MSETGTAFDAFIDALADGDGYYLACSNGHASLPPRTVCPDCGDAPLERQSLPDRGEVESHTTIRVPAPQFEADAPYVLAIASFGPVRLTGRLEGVDPDGSDIDVGLPVTATVRESDDERVILLTPQ